MKPLRISRDQISELAQARREAFPARVAQFLARSAAAARPDPAPGLAPFRDGPGDPLQALAAAAIDRAAGYGLVSEHDLAFFALRELEQGPDWEKRPEQAVALGALTDPAVAGPDRVDEIIRRETIALVAAAGRADARPFDDDFLSGAEGGA